MVRIVGTGACVPQLRVTNERLVRAIPGPNHKPWTAEEVEQKTGIRERRFVFDFDEEAGRVILPDGYGRPPGPSCRLAEEALSEALTMAGLQGSDLDGLILVSCTPDRLNFNDDALRLHKRFGLSPEAFAWQMDTGCGGALYNLHFARKMIEGGMCKRVAVVGVNVTSPYLFRDVFTSELEVGGKTLGAFLTMYLFGDGAGAAILAHEASGRGILASMATNEHLELVVRPGGGALQAPGLPHTTAAHHAYYVDGKLVKDCFGPAMKASIECVMTKAVRRPEEIARYYLHQANKRLVESFAASMDIPEHKLAMHMERYGNTSAAGTLILLAEDVRNGVVKLGSGDLILMAAIGAGAQSAAHLIRL